MPLAVVVFDFDNTLVHTSGNADAAIAEILRRYGCELHGAELARVIRRARSDYGLVQTLLDPAVVASAYDEVTAASTNSLQATCADESILQLLETLRKRFAIYVYSARDPHSLDAALRSTGLGRRISGSATGAPNCVKPYPMMLRRLLAGRGHRPEDAIYVGDLLTDYWLALNAGCRFIGATWFHDRLPPSILKCANPEELEPLLNTSHVSRMRSWKLARRAASCLPNSGYSRNPSA